MPEVVGVVEDMEERKAGSGDGWTIMETASEQLSGGACARGGSGSWSPEG